MIISQIIGFSLILIADQFGTEGARSKGYFVLKSFLVPVLAIFGMIAALGDMMREINLKIFEHVLVYSSFVPNMAMRFELGPSAITRLCPSQPGDAWLAFVGDDVMVALPATSSAAERAYMYRWGQCGREERRPRQ
jgi:hypothetical protein